MLCFCSCWEPLLTLSDSWSYVLDKYTCSGSADIWDSCNMPALCCETTWWAITSTKNELSAAVKKARLSSNKTKRVSAMSALNIAQDWRKKITEACCTYAVKRDCRRRNMIEKNQVSIYVHCSWRGVTEACHSKTLKDLILVTDHSV